MQISEAPARLTFESRSLSGRTWLTWGLVFLPGLAALLLLPEAARFLGLIGWMALWLASIFLLPRWVGDRVRVTVDRPARRVTWERNGQVTRSVAFGEVQKFEVRPISTGSRPYRAFQLVAVMRDGSRMALAVDPKESLIQRCLALARQYSR